MPPTWGMAITFPRSGSSIDHGTGHCFAKAYEYLLEHDEVWFTTAEEIYDWYIANPPA